MKKVLFIDRDGTLVVEPPVTFQIDGFEKLKFIPGVITWLGKIARELDYELVMVTNQDGLGTKSFPEKNFWPVQDFMIDTLKNEGIKFSKVCIDKSFEKQNKPTRKPRTGMLKKYLNGTYDLQNSYVIGDRLTDVELAVIRSLLLTAKVAEAGMLRPSAKYTSPPLLIVPPIPPKDFPPPVFERVTSALVLPPVMVPLIVKFSPTERLLLPML